MKTMLHAFAALTLATILAACGGTKPADRTPAPAAAAQHTPGAHVDAEDYAGPRQAVTAKRFDPAVTEKKIEKGKCKIRNNKGRCTAWHADKTTTVEKDDADFVLILADQTEVDVDQDTYDSYDLTDADTAGDVFPRS
jgi:hypothetical protein